MPVVLETTSRLASHPHAVLWRSRSAALAPLAVVLKVGSLLPRGMSMRADLWRGSLLQTQAPSSQPVSPCLAPPTTSSRCFFGRVGVSGYYLYLRLSAGGARKPSPIKRLVVSCENTSTRRCQRVEFAIAPVQWNATCSKRECSLGD